MGFLYHSLTESSVSDHHNASYNDSLRHAERRRVFDVPELKCLAAESVNRKEGDITRFEKLAEGRSNRTFLITMRDGFRLVARIPYPVTEPKSLVIASEVATMDFLRSQGIPIPRIYGYSATSVNAARTEYIFMDFIMGTNLGDIWFELSEKERSKLTSKLVELESHLFAIQFPASGSLYYQKDLKGSIKRVEIAGANSKGDRFCIGPDTQLGFWFGNRSRLVTDRGPFTEPKAVLSAGAEKEKMYLKRFGRPLHPFQRLRREIYKYQKQSPDEYITILEKYLRIAPYLIPANEENLRAPTIRHPDLQPNNIFISDKFDIVGLIDWQHCSILPLFLQCGIPKSFQNYGDRASESLQVPALPEEFNQLNEREILQQLDLLRRRQLHYFYVTKTASLNHVHYEALKYKFSMLRRKLYHRASDPWEGDNVTLKADLIHLVKNWSDITMRTNGPPPCPISFDTDEISECLRLDAEQIESDEQLDSCRDVIGMGPEGWVPSDQYEEAKERSMKLKADALEEAESDIEKAQLLEHWPFDDFDEDEYL